MKIEQAQAQRFARRAEQHFIEEMCAHVREHHAAAASRFTGPELERAVIGAVARARSHGLTLKSRIAFFVALSFEVGPRFDEHPWIRPFFGVASLSPDDRVQLLAGVPGTVWRAVMSRPADGAAGGGS